VRALRNTKEKGRGHSRRLYVGGSAVEVCGGVGGWTESPSVKRLGPTPRARGVSAHGAGDGYATSFLSTRVIAVSTQPKPRGHGSGEGLLLFPTGDHDSVRAHGSWSWPEREERELRPPHPRTQHTPCETPIARCLTSGQIPVRVTPPRQICFFNMPYGGIHYRARALRVSSHLRRNGSWAASWR
jgi:hypothetical protein